MTLAGTVWMAVLAMWIARLHRVHVRRAEPRVPAPVMGMVRRRARRRAGGDVIVACVRGWRRKESRVGSDKPSPTVAYLAINGAS